MVQRSDRKHSETQAISQQMADWGLADLHDHRPAFSDELSHLTETFPGVMASLRSDQSDPELITRWRETHEPREQLKLLAAMSVRDGIECLRFGANRARAADYLSQRLNFYEDLISCGSATFDGDRLSPADKSAVSPDGIQKGLKRDLLFAAMLGSPELAVYNLAHKWCKERSLPTGHMPTLRGYHSGIWGDQIGSYEQLFTLYEEAKNVVLRRSTADQNHPHIIEHKAVILAATWLTKAMEYNPRDRTPHSPYAAPIEEAIAWARLGEGVQRQLRGMRHKIQGVDLHGIPRFIGKAGENRYAQRASRLSRTLKVLQEFPPSEQARTVVERYKELDMRAHEKTSARERQRIIRSFERSYAQIKSASLPAEEETLQLETAETRLKTKLAALDRVTEEKREYLRNRTGDQLIVELESRLAATSAKIEQSKSLAQKAIDLHFHFNHKDAAGQTFAGLVDWINSASWGQIKRAHRMLSEGISDEKIMAVTLDDWCFTVGKLLGGYQFRVVQKLIDGAKATRLCSDPLDHPQIGPAIVDVVTRQLGESRDTGLSESLGIAQSNLRYLNPTFERLARHLQLITFSDLAKLAEAQPTYLQRVLSDPEFTPLITKELVPTIQSLHLRWEEAEALLKDGIDLRRCLAERDFKSVVEGLKRSSAEWQDEYNVSGPFEGGAAIFGYEAMLAYGDRAGLTRHDAFFNFDKIRALQRESGLTPQQFSHNILRQVVMDRAAYREGTAHHHMNMLANALGPREIQSVFERSKRFGSIKRLGEFIEAYRDPAAVFTSWNGFKRFGMFHDLLDRTAALGELAQLRSSGAHNKLCDYVEALAFSESRVDMHEAIKFATDPGAFFDNPDTHTPADVHRRKKPSNYTHIPHLDLTAEDLRDALVEGHIDSLQVFTPFEIRYRIPRNGQIDASSRRATPSVRDQLREALGSSREGIQGTARDIKALFHASKQLLKEAGITPQEYLSGAVAAASTEAAIAALIADSSIGVPHGQGRDDREMFTVIAKINLKSDPHGVLAGNDTSCCMPFGSGKNNVYTFNPNCALFTVQVVNGNDTARTIAQSVLTKDRDVEMPITEVLAKLSSESDMSKIFPERLLRVGPAYLACDNIEVAPNYTTHTWDRVLNLVYQDFFSEYMRRFASRQGLNPAIVPIGMSHSDALRNHDTITNTFIPLAPVSYSDKTGQEVYALRLSTTPLVAEREITEYQVERRAETGTDVEGVRQLDFSKTLGVAYLEGKVYAGTPELIVHLHNIENGLIAKDINNQKKNRPNLSVQYTDPTGQLRGYLIAYEGAYDSQIGSAELLAQERIVYIADVAADTNSRIAGGKLITAFVDLYSRNYLTNGDPIPIYAELRDQTSYKLLKRQIDSLSLKLGYEVEMVEHSPYYEGSEQMHPVVIRCTKRKVARVALIS